MTDIGHEAEAASPPDTPATSKPPASIIDFVALALVVAAALLLAAGLLYAFAVVDARAIRGAERFRLLAQASSPFIAALALGGVGLVVNDRRRRQHAQAQPTAVLIVGTVVSLLALLLAVNGVVVDLTSSAGTMFTVSNVLGRMATVVLSAFTLALCATTPLTAPVVAANADPVHS
jgi:hypothetical protein